MHPLPFYLPEPETGGLSSCIHLCHPPNASATLLGPSRPQPRLPLAAEQPTFRLKPRKHEDQVVVEVGELVQLLQLLPQAVKDWDEDGDGTLPRDKNRGRNAVPD